MKILILGGAGFVGANLAVYLTEVCQYEVVCLDNLVRSGVELNLDELREKNIQFIHGDIRNQEDLFNLDYDFDVVLLCAAQPSAVNYKNPVFDLTNNTFGAMNVIEFCRERGPALIFWSTNKCYPGNVINQHEFVKSGDRFVWSGNPAGGYFDPAKGFNESTPVDGKDHSIYGLSKIAADLMCQEFADAYSIPCIINRFSCLSGPRQFGKAEQGWVTWFAIANILDLPIEIFGFDGNQVRDCLFIDDLSKLIAIQIENICNKDKDGKFKYRGEVFNVGGGIDHTLSVNEAMNHIYRQTKIPQLAKVNEAVRRSDQAIYVSDITKVSNEFAWKPEISIEDGYHSIIKWVRDNKSQLKKLYK